MTARSSTHLPQIREVDDHLGLLTIRDFSQHLQVFRLGSVLCFPLSIHSHIVEIIGEPLILVFGVFVVVCG